MLQYNRSLNFDSSREARVTATIEGGREWTEEEEQYMEALMDDADFYGQNLEYDDEEYSDSSDVGEDDWEDDDFSEPDRSRPRQVKRIGVRAKPAPRPPQRPLMGTTRKAVYPASVVKMVQRINDAYGYNKESLFDYYKHAYARANRRARLLGRVAEPVSVGSFKDGFQAYLNSGFQIRTATNEQLASLKIADPLQTSSSGKQRAPRVTFGSSKEPPEGRSGWSLGFLLAGKPMMVYFWVDKGATSAHLIKAVRRYLTTLQADPLAFSLKFGTKKIIDLVPDDFARCLEEYSAVRADPLILGGAGKKNGQAKKKNGDGKKKKKKVSMMTSVSRAVKSVVKGIPKAVNDNLNFLSPCAMKLAIAIADPFDPRAIGVCGLIGNTQFSQKSSNYCTTSVGAASVGFGFVAFSPTIASDGIQAYYTSVGASATSVVILSANNTLADGVSALTAVGLPHATSALTNGASNSATTLQGRMLAYGARIKWNGAELYRGGTVQSVHRSNHENVTVIGGSAGSAPAASNIAQWEGTMTSGIGAGTYYVNCFPVNTSETNYTSDEQDVSTNSSLTHPYSRSETEMNGYTYSAASTNQGSPIALFAWNGATTNGSSFTLETITHCEYVGSSCRSQATASEVDPIGHEIVMNASARLGRALRTSPGLNPSRVMRDLLIGAASSFTSIPTTTIRSGLRALKI